MKRLRVVFRFTALAVAATVAGCGGGSPTEAWENKVVAGAPVAGINAFIATVPLTGRTLFDQVASVNFVIAPAAGTVSKPVSVTYSHDYLVQGGYLTPGTNTMSVPVFGLYAGAQNAVTLTVNYDDGTDTSVPVSVTTAADVADVYTQPSVTKQRAAGSALGFDFFFIKSNLGAPVIMDTDGRVRWRGPVLDNLTSFTSDFFGNQFVIGDGQSQTIVRIALDGSFDDSATDSVINYFHHDMEHGKTELLADVGMVVNGILQLESVVQEIQPDGTVINQWDMGKILSDYMAANGDDPTQFVRNGVDWFHMNTAIYDAADDSLIVSSRENFVMKLDYTTGAIRWIFGDPTKYWYTFPSLRAKALTLTAGGLVPIGQHSVTIAPDGNLMLFNNGLPSANQPPGAPIGQSRPYSEVSSYVIDDNAMTATESWGFDYGQTIRAPICSSARQVPEGSVLVDYASAVDGAYLVGLDAQRNVVFDYRFQNTGCSTAWNSQPIALDALTLD